jgi:hypothetical protein
MNVPGFTFPPGPGGSGGLVGESELVVGESNTSSSPYQTLPKPITYSAEAVREARLKRFCDDNPLVTASASSEVILSPPQPESLDFDDLSTGGTLSDTSPANSTVGSVAAQVLAALAPMLEKMVENALKRPGDNEDSPVSKRRKR